MVKLKERGKGGSSRKQKKDLSKVTCYNCKETGHFKSDCPKLKKEEKPKKGKKKGLMASWEDLENDSEDDEESETKSQPCLMDDHVEQFYLIGKQEIKIREYWKSYDQGRDCAEINPYGRHQISLTPL
ncbi:zinc finger CCHC-type and RNA-binding motif-containing protein 1-like [Arachis ipaensis]|uniref:zinc finger CCHC-type and RNA-binding motif-containing protein 1-like n=1 Tax=Arachis ipaensis TaxID=130454 RepID=UPI0007AFCBA9|nr:zinc finger CCHC-type and RNA-binding motif-containing protein 1-like [Arachis ipaensis]